MRPSVRRFVSLACCAGTALVWAGCSGKKVTEYVPGISTQVTVPRDLKAIRVEVTIGGAQQFCQSYKVYEGKVLLPRSLGNFANSDATLGEGAVTYTISGVASDDLAQEFFAQCTAPTVGSDNLRVLRRSRQPFVQDETLFLPMPLKYSCYDKNCPDVGGDQQTCKGGKCVAPDLTPEEQKQLVPYSPELVDGTGAACFSTSICMLLATPAPVVDATKCLYAVPNSKDAPPLVPGATNPAVPSGDGVNVELSYDGGLVHEVLDLDVSEGFFIPDPTKPQQFQLAPGLCELVKGVDDKGVATTHRITGVRASGTCQSKTIFQPICAPDQNKAMGLDENGVTPNPGPVQACSSIVLSPAAADLMVVVDDSPANQTFFDNIKNSTIDPQNQDTLVAVAVKGALNDPAFEKTKIGLIYTQTGTQACKNDAVPDKGLTPSSTARDDILNDLKAHPVGAGASQIEPALQRAYSALGADSGAFRKAVLVLAQGNFVDATPAACTNPPAVSASELAKTKASQIPTYVMQLTTQAPPSGRTDPNNSTWPADILANRGGTGQAGYKSQDGAVKFEDVVNYLATCIYDLSGVPPTSIPKDGDSVAYINPLSNIQTTLPFNNSCSAADSGTGAGWGLSPVVPGQPQRMFLCSSSCNDYRAVLAQATQFAALYQQPALSIPVFSYRSPDKTTGLCP